MKLLQDMLVEKGTYFCSFKYKQKSWGRVGELSDDIQFKRLQTIFIG